MNWYKLQIIKEASIKEILKGMGLVIAPTVLGFLLGNMAENLYAKYTQNPQELKQEIINKAEENNLNIKEENNQIIIEEPKKETKNVQEEVETVQSKIEKLLDALRIKESSGGKRLLGDYENGVPKAKGNYQLHKEFWIDGCKFGGVNWNYERDVFDDAKCRDVIKWYWQRYAKKAYNTGNLEILARIHNGGPNFGTESTNQYWLDVKNLLNN